MKVVVLGGTGFLGRAICRLAASEGLKVVSISRQGYPPYLIGPRASRLLNEWWTDSVQWESCDFTNPRCIQEAEPLFRGAQGVIDCVGTLLPGGKSNNSYQAIHVDCTKHAVDLAASVGVRRFVYVSAAEQPPFVPKAYLASKRRAEELVLSKPGTIARILRPGLMYGSERMFTVVPFVILGELYRLGLIKNQNFDALPVTRVALAALGLLVTEPDYPVPKILQPSDIRAFVTSLQSRAAEGRDREL